MSAVRWDDEGAAKAISAICLRVTDGESVRGILSYDETDLPTRATWHEWLRADRCGCAAIYKQALEDRAHVHAEEVVTIADELKGASTPEQIAAARVRIDSRKWSAGRMLPRVYGDKIQAEHTGAGGGAIEHKHVHNLSDIDLERIASGSSE